MILSIFSEVKFIKDITTSLSKPMRNQWLPPSPLHKAIRKNLQNKNQTNNKDGTNFIKTLQKLTKREEGMFFSIWH